MFCLWGSPHVHLFATMWNAKLPTFVSPVPDPGTWQWMPSVFHGWKAYAFPPHQLLTKVLHKLHQSNTALLLVAPAWPALPWFPNHLELSIKSPWWLLVTETVLRQSWLDRFHLDPGTLQLQAWRLSGGHLARLDSPGRQQIDLQPLKPCPPSPSMIDSEESDVQGMCRHV